MSSTIKNILIFAGIAAVMVLAYVFFFQKPAPVANLTTSTGAPATAPAPGATTSPSQIGSDFLSVLLNVKNIKLDDSIFSDNAFISLHDSSILLINDGTEGRPNPFAPIGTDNTVSSVAPAAATANALNSINNLNTIAPPTTIAPSSSTGSVTPPAPQIIPNPPQNSLNTIIPTPKQ